MNEAQKLGYLLEEKISTDLKKLNIFDTILNEKETVKLFGKTFYGIDHVVILQNKLITIQDKWENTTPDKQQISDFINVTEKIKSKLDKELLCAIFASKMKMTPNGKEKLEHENKKYTEDIYLSISSVDMDMLSSNIMKTIQTKLLFNGIKVNKKQYNKIILRDDQKQDIINFKEKMLEKDGIKTGIIVKPTGTGKTISAGGCIMAYIGKYNGSIIWITERIDVLKSQFDNKEKIALYVNSGILPKFDEYQYIFWYNDKSDTASLNEKLNNNKPVLLITNTASLLYNKRYEDINKDKIGMILVDECHWFGAEQRYDFAMYAINNWKNLKIILGFSATPIRPEKDNVSRFTKIFGDGKHAYFISVMTFCDALEKKIIEPPEFYWIALTLDKNISSSDFSKGLNKLVYEKLLKDIDHILGISTTKKGIMWGSTVNNIEEWNKIFTEAKNDSKKYPNISKYKFLVTHSKSKENSINHFLLYDKPAILLAVEQAKEGFDDPKIDLVGNLTVVQNRSMLKEQQQNGRALRTYHDSLNKIVKKKGIIFDCFSFDKEEDKIRKIVEMLCNYMLLLHNVESLDPSYNPTKEYNKIINALKIDANDGKVILKLGNGKDIVFNIANIIQTELKHLEWKDIPNKIKEQLRDKIYIDGISCRKAMEIIKDYKIMTKERYYEICEQDPRLPKDPESVYDNFPGWIEYLQIPRSNYYEKLQHCMEAINKIRKLYANEIKEMKDNLDEIYNFCKTKDEKLPALPCDYYKLQGIRNMGDIITINKKIKILI